MKEEKKKGRVLQVNLTIIKSLNLVIQNCKTWVSESHYLFSYPTNGGHQTNDSRNPMENKNSLTNKMCDRLFFVYTHITNRPED